MEDKEMKLATYEEAASFIKERYKVSISAFTVAEWARKNPDKLSRIKLGRSILINLDELEKYIHSKVLK